MCTEYAVRIFFSNFTGRGGADILMCVKSRILTERISANENVTERSGAERGGYPSLTKTTERSGFFKYHTERSGADIRMWGKSRIVAMRISTRTDYCGADIRRTDFFTERIAPLRGIIRTNRGISPRCTVCLLYTSDAADE